MKAQRDVAHQAQPPEIGLHLTLLTLPFVLGLAAGGVLIVGERK